MSHFYPGPPSAPESIHVCKVGKNFADLEWTLPVSDGGAKITLYRIYRSTILPAVWEEVAKVRNTTLVHVTLVLLPLSLLFFFHFWNVLGKGEGESYNLFPASTLPIMQILPLTNNSCLRSRWWPASCTRDAVHFVWYCAVDTGPLCQLWTAVPWPCCLFASTLFV